MKLRPPLESDGAIATTIDTTVMVEGSGVTYEVIERGLVNVINGSRAGIDWSLGDDDEGHEIVYRAQTSIATWGEGEALDLDLSQLGTWQQAYDLLTGQLAQRIHALWGVPYARIEVSVGTRKVGWGAEVMEHAIVSHPRLPTDTTVGRGGSSAAMIYGITPMWRGARRAGVLLICSSPGGERLSAYAPTASGTAVSGTDITCADHAYSRTDEGIDAELFPAGTRVRVYKPGDESTAVRRIVDTIVPGGADATVIRTTVACGLSAPVVVELDTYDTPGATAQQKTYAHMSNGGYVTADPCFEYA